MNKKDSAIIASIIGASATIIAAIITAIATCSGSITNNKETITSASLTEKESSDLSFSESRTRYWAYQLDEFDETTNSETSTETVPDKEDNSIDKKRNIKRNNSDIFPLGWSGIDAYQIYYGGNQRGFNIAGNEYNQGFTLLLEPNNDVFGNSIQYVTYKIDSVSKEYSTIYFYVGYIDNYPNNDIQIQFFLDKNINEDPDYFFNYNSSSLPKWLSINFQGHSKMTVLVSNHGSNQTKIGFADIYFKE